MCAQLGDVCMSFELLVCPQKWGTKITKTNAKDKKYQAGCRQPCPLCGDRGCEQSFGDWIFSLASEPVASVLPELLRPLLRASPAHPPHPPTLSAHSPGGPSQAREEASALSPVLASLSLLPGRASGEDVHPGNDGSKRTISSCISRETGI